MPTFEPTADAGPWPYVTPADLRLQWLAPSELWNDVMYLPDPGDAGGATGSSVDSPPPGATAKKTDGPLGCRAYYRLTTEVWAWVWQRAVALEDAVTGKGREDYREAYRQLCERVGPLMAWVEEQERAGVPGWAGGAWRGIKNPKLPAAPFVPGWVGE